MAAIEVVAVVFAVGRAGLAAKRCSESMAGAFAFTGAFLSALRSALADAPAHEVSQSDQHVNDWWNLGGREVQREFSRLERVTMFTAVWLAGAGRVGCTFLLCKFGRLAHAIGSPLLCAGVDAVGMPVEATFRPPDSVVGAKLRQLGNEAAKNQDFGGLVGHWYFWFGRVGIQEFCIVRFCATNK